MHLNKNCPVYNVYYYEEKWKGEFPPQSLSQRKTIEKGPQNHEFTEFTVHISEWDLFMTKSSGVNMNTYVHYIVSILQSYVVYT